MTTLEISRAIGLQDIRMSELENKLAKITNQTVTAIGVILVLRRKGIVTDDEIKEALADAKSTTQKSPLRVVRPEQTSGVQVNSKHESQSSGLPPVTDSGVGGAG